MKKILVICLLFISFSSVFALETKDYNNIGGFDLSKLLATENVDLLSGSIYNPDCNGICFEDTLNGIFINSSSDFSNLSINIFPNFNQTDYKDLSKERLDLLIKNRNDYLFPAISLYKDIISGKKDISILKDNKLSVSVLGNRFAKEFVIDPKLIRNNKNEIIGIGYINYRQQGLSLPTEFYYNIAMLSKDGQNYIEINKKIIKLELIIKKDTLKKVLDLFDKYYENDEITSKIINVVNTYVSKNKKVLKEIDNFKNIIMN